MDYDCVCIVSAKNGYYSFDKSKELGLSTYHPVCDVNLRGKVGQSTAFYDGKVITDISVLRKTSGGDEFI